MRSLAVAVACVAGAVAHAPSAGRPGADLKAVEAHDPRAFMRYVSADFTGNDGQADRDGLHNLLRAQVLRNESVGVTLGPIDVDLLGDRATVHVTATLTGGSGGLLPERGSIYSITSGWKREGGEWKCFNAAWQQKL